jgi:hypothetical protein
MMDKVTIVNHDTLEEYHKTYPVYMYDSIANTYEKRTRDAWILIFNSPDGGVQCDIMPMEHHPNVIEIYDSMHFIDAATFNQAYQVFKRAFDKLEE